MTRKDKLTTLNDEAEVAKLTTQRKREQEIAEAEAAKLLKHNSQPSNLALKPDVVPRSPTCDGCHATYCRPVLVKSGAMPMGYVKSQALKFARKKVLIASGN